eukprot:822891-Pelagomonas_calceolata.AAC.3
MGEALGSQAAAANGVTLRRIKARAHNDQVRCKLQLSGDKRLGCVHKGVETTGSPSAASKPALKMIRLSPNCSQVGTTAGLAEFTVEWKEQAGWLTSWAPHPGTKCTPLCPHP